MAVFVTGCHHFGHANIIKLANRPFSSVEEMDEVLIERWNETVGEHDEVWHLGDFAWTDEARAAVKPRLKGRLMTIRGNHDPEGWSGRSMVKLRPRGGTPSVVLCHYPFLEWDGYWRGVVHLHCHTHKHEARSGWRRGNVTVEAHDYRPVSLDDFVHDLIRQCPMDERPNPA